MDEDGLILVEVDEPTQALHQLTGWALHRNLTLPGLVVDRPSLEDVYLQLTGAEAGDDPPSAEDRAQPGDRRRHGCCPGAEHERPDRGTRRAEPPTQQRVPAGPPGPTVSPIGPATGGSWGQAT